MGHSEKKAGTMRVRKKKCPTFALVVRTDDLDQHSEPFYTISGDAVRPEHGFKRGTQPEETVYLHLKKIVDFAHRRPSGWGIIFRSTHVSQREAHTYLNAFVPACPAMLSDAKTRDGGGTAGHADEFQAKEYHGDQGIHGPRDGQTPQPGSLPNIP